MFLYERVLSSGELLLRGKKQSLLLQCVLWQLPVNCKSFINGNQKKRGASLLDCRCALWQECWSAVQKWPLLHQRFWNLTVCGAKTASVAPDVLATESPARRNKAAGLYNFSRIMVTASLLQRNGMRTVEIDDGWVVEWITKDANENVYVSLLKNVKTWPEGLSRMGS